ncbi:MAG TPA: DUF427 domain-containing protein [Solirubrobacteraceae bacterium]|nr:DUF427 domain-containing protein [Solirubrobacteraceae bacterium]
MSTFANFIRGLGGQRPDTSGSPVEAVWNGAVIARSDATIVVEGNHYFPPESVDRDRLHPSDKRTRCPWKGQASYYTIDVDGERNEAAAWYYPSPKPAAAGIKDHVAFWRGVRVRPVT